MGLEPFEVNFFFEEKFTKFDLTLEIVIRNHSKICLKSLCDVSNDMAEEFFVCQKSYGNTIRMKFFYTQENFSVTGPGIFGRTDQKKIGTIKDLPI